MQFTVCMLLNENAVVDVQKTMAAPKQWYHDITMVLFG